MCLESSLTLDNNKCFEDDVQFIEPILNYLPGLESLELRVKSINEALQVITRSVNANPEHRLKSLKVHVPHSFDRNPLSAE